MVTFLGSKEDVFVRAEHVLQHCRGALTRRKRDHFSLLNDHRIPELLIAPNCSPAVSGEVGVYAGAS